MSRIEPRQLDFMAGVLLVAKREIRDQLRDWRIVAPIVALTLFFPALMDLTARQASDFVGRYGANPIAERLLPFLLMIVGFFPISISLVIALESFAGERERLSLEPLLATPLTDSQLYLGKMLSSLALPLLAAYLGITVYLTGLALRLGWYAPPGLLVQVVLLTAAQALVMVSGAVVISSQSTSVRAANLLASFIIVPISELIIGESLIMFWGRYSLLWWIVIGVLVIAVLLGRMGMHMFNREQLLSREIDTLDLRRAWRHFWRVFRHGANTTAEWYREVFTLSLPRIWHELAIVAVLMVAAYAIGLSYAERFPLPPEAFRFSGLQAEMLDHMQRFGLLSVRGWGWVVFSNIRAVVIAAVAGMFSFGVLGVILLMTPLGLVGFIAGNAALAGQGAIRVLGGLIVPHAILEVPAAILAGAAILKLGMALISPPDKLSMGEHWLAALAEWARITFGIVIPLLIASGAIEVFVTPRIGLSLLGGS